ncbi:uncharacterized protein G2W53_032655 [Senna tora]|uniref:Uncharacterized protein n=1 Tax=Senna tora TaxID=362788 RepID=A0A834T863_9FABA|nr:uncharacterized protein G2W53_032655 [Senna tora]
MHFTLSATISRRNRYTARRCMTGGPRKPCHKPFSFRLSVAARSAEREQGSLNRYNAAAAHAVSDGITPESPTAAVSFSCSTTLLGLTERGFDLSALCANAFQLTFGGFKAQFQCAGIMGFGLSSPVALDWWPSRHKFRRRWSSLTEPSPSEPPGYFIGIFAGERIAISFNRKFSLFLGTLFHATGGMQLLRGALDDVSGHSWRSCSSVHDGSLSTVAGTDLVALWTFCVTRWPAPLVTSDGRPPPSAVALRSEYVGWSMEAARWWLQWAALGIGLSALPMTVYCVEVMVNKLDTFLLVRALSPQMVELSHDKPMISSNGVHLSFVELLLSCIQLSHEGVLIVCR